MRGQRLAGKNGLFELCYGEIFGTTRGELSILTDPDEKSHYRHMRLADIPDVVGIIYCYLAEFPDFRVNNANTRSAKFPADKHAGIGLFDYRYLSIRGGKYNQKT